MFSFSRKRSSYSPSQQSRRSSHRSRREALRQLRLEGLEERRVLASIVWVNQNNDHFEEVFGAQADVARGVVNGVIDAWEDVITNFHNNNGNTYNLYLRMATQADVDEYGFGGDVNRYAGQAPPSSITVVNGIPQQGLVLLGRGTDGHGSNYFLDPTPHEHSEFQGDIINAFAGEASDPAAQGKMDLYSLVQAEVVHALGITSATNSRYRELINAGAAGVNGVSLTDTGVLDQVFFGTGATLWEFDGPSIHYLMSDIDGGNKGQPAHSALPHAQNVVVGNDNVVLRGNVNLSNPSLGNGQRLLISNAAALMLHDVYGYTLAAGGPERQATFYALQDSGGDVHVRGTAAADSVVMNSQAAYMQVSVNPGDDIPGTDPFSPGSFFASRFVPASIDGTVVDLAAGNDTLVANGAFAGLGSIALNGQDGDDNLSWALVTGHSVVINGGSGNDTLRGGAIADTISGGNGNDVIYGNNGNDNLTGEEDDDRIFGGNGNDVIRGREGQDRLYGENNNDQIFAGPGDDDVFGGSGDDSILGDLGNDRLEGGAGNDNIQGNRGNDTIIGGAAIGNIALFIPDGIDILSGNEDNDIIFGDNVVGQTPTVLGGDGDNISGGDGHDRLSGGVGNDVISGGIGLDIIHGNLGADNINGNEDADQLFGDEDNDLVRGDGGNDYMLGGAGNDEMYGDAGDDRVNGQTGDDTLYGGIGNDTLRGEAGDDLLRGEAGHDLMLGGDGRDSLFAGTGRDFLIGGLGADRLTGDSDDDILVAGTTIHDNSDRALLSIMSEWRSAHGYIDRVFNLRNQPHPGFALRLNGERFLRSGIEVFNDAGGNVLSGLTGTDLFYFGAGDTDDATINEATN